jgi:hypothetical protein
MIYFLKSIYCSIALDILSEGFFTLPSRDVHELDIASVYRPKCLGTFLQLVYKNNLFC